ncbi:MAG TPA: enolase C-terminal domain-like protein [Candidatus Limnocylindrales bacterium]|nr:enolase C-terminal domain-like protein [Candidatus Limnocylindrales bacterium]
MTAALAVRRVRVPFRVPFETASGAWTARESLIVQLQSDAGTRGTGEAPIDASHSTAVLEVLLQRLLDGRAEDIPDALRHAFGAAVGGALLDLAAPSENVGSAVGAGVAVNATIGAGSVGESVEAAASAAAAGYRTLKLKAGAREAATTLVDRVLEVRAAVGPHVALRLDANGSWTVHESVARLRPLAGVLEYVEQPLPVDARDDAARLRTMVEVPVAADEAVATPRDAVALVERGAADVLVVKPARVGGPGAVAVIASAAAARGVPVVISSLFETGIGLAAAMACAATLPDVPGWPAADRAHGLATADVLEHDLLAAPLIVSDGRIRAPFDPGSGGLGIVPDEAAMERYGVTDA